ncbi:MAG: hypothetical protein EZS28_056230, partial [Streblomastix strix]
MIESETEEWSEILIHLDVMKCELQVDLYHEVLGLQQLSETLNIFHYEMYGLEMFIQQRAICYLSTFSLILLRYRNARIDPFKLLQRHILDYFFPAAIRKKRKEEPIYKLDIHLKHIRERADIKQRLNEQEHFGCTI